MIVSVTEVETFLRCRTKWDYTSFNRQSLTPVINAPALEVGSLIHATLAQWTEHPAMSKADVLAFYAVAGTKSLTATSQAYEERVGCKPAPAELERVMEAITLGYAMIGNYIDYWKSPLPDGFMLVQTEQTLLVPIPNTTHNLEGTLDGLIADESGYLYVLERKTFGQHPTDGELDRKYQFLAYMWALRQLYGERVRGMAYDGLWKREVPGKTGRHTSPDSLFLRKLLVRPSYEIELFGREIAAQVSDMFNEPNLYRTVPFTDCWDCPMQKLCDAEHRGEDANFVRNMQFHTRPRTTAFQEDTSEAV